MAFRDHLVPLASWVPLANPESMDEMDKQGHQGQLDQVVSLGEAEFLVLMEM